MPSAPGPACVPITDPALDIIGWRPPGIMEASSFASVSASSGVVLCSTTMSSTGPKSAAVLISRAMPRRLVRSFASSWT